MWELPIFRVRGVMSDFIGGSYFFKDPLSLPPNKPGDVYIKRTLNINMGFPGVMVWAKSKEKILHKHSKNSRENLIFHII